MTNFDENKTEKDNLEYEMKIWEKTIDVQMHFNEAQMKIRNFSLLLVSALVGAGGIALKEHILIDYTFFTFHVQTNLSAILFAVAAFSWLAFFFMDHYWYYPLLIGSVRHGAQVEKNLLERLPSIGLTSSIGDASPSTFFGKKLHSKHKSYIFYFSVFFLLVGLACATGWAPVGSQKDAKPETGTSKAKTEVPPARRSKETAGTSAPNMPQTNSESIRP